MPSESSLISAAAVLIVVCVVIVVVSPAMATDKLHILHQFKGKNGADLLAGLIFDPAGSLYGTTYEGGNLNCVPNDGCGTAFELTRGANGKWTETVLYRFCSAYNCTDGQLPHAGLVRDAAGNLYGTTLYGGTYDYGTVFELSPGNNGAWTETVLHSFNLTTTDGAHPEAGLVFDSAGNLYGTTFNGGSCGPYDICGTVFELSPGANGAWTEKLLFLFNGGGTNPYAGLILDSSGNLYGTTLYGGDDSCNFSCGVAFELIPRASGKWSERVLRRFKKGRDGYWPYAGLISDTSGNLYGTAAGGGNLDCGAYGCGVVFELMPGANGKWSEKVLYRFSRKAGDGYSPWANLVFDVSGNLYGTTTAGGAYGYGTIFQLSPTGSGQWTETVLESFDGSQAGLIFGSDGNLYGTAGDFAFELAP